MEATVESERIIISGSGSLTKEKWEKLLDDLKAEHVPSFTPNGKRMSVFVSPNGRTDRFIYRTAQLPDADIIRILTSYDIATPASPNRCIA